jgi:hypothetical protein
MSDDHSPGDRRQPYSDRGGPQGRHAETHDVERERLTNPKGPDSGIDQRTADLLENQTPASIRQAQTEGTSAASDSVAVNNLPELSNDDLASLTILAPDTPLEQGSVYLNLDDSPREPFRASGDMTAGKIGRVIAKKMTDYEIWNRLTQ